MFGHSQSLMRVRAAGEGGGRPRVRPAWFVGLVVFTAVGLGAGIALADVPDGNTVNVCENKSTHVVRVIDKTNTTCNTTTETPYSWTVWKWHGAWSSATAYKIGDAVSYLGQSYVATAVSTNKAPATNPSLWGLLAAKGATGPAGPGTPQLSKPNIAKLRWDLDPARGRTVSVGAQPVWSAFDGTNIWVTNHSDNTLSKIVAATGAVTTITPSPALNGPEGIAFDGTNLWVASTNGNKVSQIRPSDGAVLHQVLGLNAPFGVAFDGTKVWVTNNGAATASRINRVGTPAIDGTATVGSGPRGIVFDGTHLWIANTGGSTVSEVNPATAATIGSPISVGTCPQGVASDGATVWVVNSCANTVSKIDLGTATVTATVNVGNCPIGAAFDGTHVWVTNSCDNTVSKIDPATNSVIATGGTYSAAEGITFDGTDMWITNTGASTVSKVRAP